MKIIKKFSLFVFSLIPFCLLAEQVLPDQVKHVLSLTHHNHQSVWPNLNLNDSPTLLLLDDESIYGLNLKAPQSSWKKIDNHVHRALRDTWKVQQLKLHPAYDIDGENVFVFRLGDDRESLKIFAHERFHRYQLLNFKPEKMAIGEYQDHFNAENLTLMKIEDAILYKFLQAPDTEKEHLLRDFIHVFNERISKIKDESRHWEDHQQKMEGLADYVSAMMFDREKQIIDNIENLNADGDFSDYVIKWRHYSVGATLAFALDFLQVQDWKIQVEDGAFLSEILLKAIDPAHDSKELDRIKQKYRYANIKEEMSQKVKEYQEQMDTLFEKYQSLPGPILRFAHPKKLGISGGGTTERILSLADGTTLSLNDQSFSSTTDSKWKFETNEIPFLIQNRAGFREIKMGRECSLVLNSQVICLESLMVAPPKEYPFRQISVKGNQFSFSSESHRGSLVFDGNHLFIRYF
ncbi:MAG: hypothetical protein ACSNEK_07430 [Parachlamydiaceae bacterium]